MVFKLEPFQTSRRDPKTHACHDSREIKQNSYSSSKKSYPTFDEFEHDKNKYNVTSLLRWGEA